MSSQDRESHLSKELEESVRILPFSTFKSQSAFSINRFSHPLSPLFSFLTHYSYFNLCTTELGLYCYCSKPQHIHTTSYRIQINASCFSRPFMVKPLTHASPSYPNSPGLNSTNCLKYHCSYVPLHPEHTLHNSIKEMLAFFPKPILNVTFLQRQFLSSQLMNADRSKGRRRVGKINYRASLVFTPHRQW